MTISAKMYFDPNAMHDRRLSWRWMDSAFDCEFDGLLFDCIIPMDFSSDICEEYILIERISSVRSRLGFSHSYEVVFECIICMISTNHYPAT